MFIGNSQQYSKLETWIKKPLESTEKLSYKHICIVIGAPGIGKTFGIENAITSCSKIMYRINDLDCNNSKDFKDLLNKITSSHIISQFENISIHQKVLWIDDFDSFLIFDRTFLHTLENILDDGKSPAIRIVISTTNADMKHYSKFYNSGFVIKLKIPDVADIIIFLRKTFPKLPVKILTQIAEHSNGNISSAIHMVRLEEPQYINSVIDKPLNNQPSQTTQTIQPVISKAVSKTRKKVATNTCPNIDINEHLAEPVVDPLTSTIFITNPLSFKLTDKFPGLVDLFNLPYNFQVGRYIFDQDPWLHPLRFHENVIHELNQRKGLQHDKEAIYIDILRLLCIWDQLMSYSKINDGSGMFIAIELISNIPLYLKDFPKKKTTVSSMDEFTRMFNYLSLKKKHAVALYIPDFPWISIGSYYKHIYDAKNKKKPKTKNFST
jgi:hypothetical protein